MDSDILSIPLNIKHEIQHVLLDEVNPSLRGIAFEWDPENTFVLIFFYNDGPISDGLQDHYASIDCEASARFFFDGLLLEHDYKMVNLPYPEQLPNHKYWVYRRREPFVDPVD